MDAFNASPFDEKPFMANQGPVPEEEQPIADVPPVHARTVYDTYRGDVPAPETLAKASAFVAENGGKEDPNLVIEAANKFGLSLKELTDELNMKQQED